jgi:hypothetical protein
MSDHEPLPPVDPAAVRTEVVDRLRAIGRLGEHIAAGREPDIGLALDTCERLLAIARSHHDLATINNIPDQSPG